MLFWLGPRSDETCGMSVGLRRNAGQEPLPVLLFKLAQEKESDQHLNAYLPEGGNYGNHVCRHQGPRRGQGTTTKNACYMSNVQDVFWCDAEDEHGGLLHAPDCDQHECIVVQHERHEADTCGKAKMPNHNTCTITCAFGGKRKHYEDGCYHKQRLLAKLTERGPEWRWRCRRQEQSQEKQG